MRLDLVVNFDNLKYESSTIILFVGVRHFLRDLLSDLLSDLQTRDRRQIR